jgi:hypothetical protein
LDEQQPPALGLGSALGLDSVLAGGVVLLLFVPEQHEPPAAAGLVAGGSEIACGIDTGVMTPGACMAGDTMVWGTMGWYI